MEIIINETQDLLTVAAILVKNGYTVRKARKRKKEGSTAWNTILIVTMEDKP